MRMLPSGELINVYIFYFNVKQIFSFEIVPWLCHFITYICVDLARFQTIIDNLQNNIFVIAELQTSLASNSSTHLLVPDYLHEHYMPTMCAVHSSHACAAAVQFRVILSTTNSTTFVTSRVAWFTLHYSIACYMLNFTKGNNYTINYSIYKL